MIAGWKDKTWPLVIGDHGLSTIIRVWREALAN